MTRFLSIVRDVVDQAFRIYSELESKPIANDALIECRRNILKFMSLLVILQG